VPDLDAARAAFARLPGTRVSEPVAIPEHGVTVVFAELPNTKIELVAPLGERSPLATFLQKNPGGGIHHLSLEVPDVRAAAAALAAQARVLGEGERDQRRHPVSSCTRKTSRGRSSRSRNPPDHTAPRSSAPAGVRSAGF
jgi:methylmalonyl-CoA/ethylmalonyl-CoA epimerase